VNKTVLRCFLKIGRDTDDKAVPRPSGSDRESTIANRRCAVAGTISTAVATKRSVAVTRPPPPGDGHQLGTVVQVHSDSLIHK